MTLIELIVVLVIMSSAAALAMPAFVQDRTVQTAAAEIERVVQRAFLAAAKHGQSARLVIETNAKKYWLGPAADWPRTIWNEDTIAVQPGIALSANTNRLDVIILPDGTASTASIKVYGRTDTVSVDIANKSIAGGVKVTRRRAD